MSKAEVNFPKVSVSVREVAFIMWFALSLIGGGRSIFLHPSGGEPFFSQCDIVFKSANHIINATSLRFGETELID